MQKKKKTTTAAAKGEREKKSLHDEAKALGGAECVIFVNTQNFRLL